MQEEFIFDKMIKGKTDKEIENELVEEIMLTKEKLNLAIRRFEYAEDDLIDYCIYQIKANQSKLNYLIKKAKHKGIVLDRINEIKIRGYIKNNIAG